MKLHLLLFTALMMFSTVEAQVKPAADSSGDNLKKTIELTRLPEVDEKNLSVFPNPSSGIINMALTGFKGKKTQLSVVNVIGTVIYRETIQSSDNSVVKSIDMRKNANGLYYVKLEADDYSEIRKVILK